MITVAVFLAAAAMQGIGSREPVLPAWLSGCWEQREGERWTEECWTTPRGGMMLGMGRSGRGDRVGEWEVMRIALNEPNPDGPVIRMAFVAAPQGQGWTVFGWSPTQGPGVTFFNVAHDYPQRIRYWRDGEALMAEIAMTDGSRSRQWRYRRMPAPGTRAVRRSPPN